MRKGEATRQRIVVRTADLLNTQGYRATPVSEIMRVSGLEKGGIYRHFESRDVLALEAFEFAVARVRNRFLQAIEGRKTAKDKLFALLEVARHAPREEAFHGGCPVMNLAVESDDADPKLRNAARRAMRQVIGLFEQIIAEGMKQGEFPEGDARSRARMLVASMEGAILLTNLYKDGTYMVSRQRLISNRSRRSGPSQSKTGLSWVVLHSSVAAVSRAMASVSAHRG